MAATMPNALQQFFNENGEVLAFGTVEFYVPGTSVPKTTYREFEDGAPHDNPIVLDEFGYPSDGPPDFNRFPIYGIGNYRQVLREQGTVVGTPDGVVVWDDVATATFRDFANVISGDYAPLFSEEDNLDSISADDNFSVFQTGTLVQIWGLVTLNPTAATPIEFRVTVPVIIQGVGIGQLIPYNSPASGIIGSSIGVDGDFFFDFTAASAVSTEQEILVYMQYRTTETFVP